MKKDQESISAEYFASEKSDAEKDILFRETIGMMSAAQLRGGVGAVMPSAYLANGCWTKTEKGFVSLRYLDDLKPGPDDRLHTEAASALARCISRSFSPGVAHTVLCLLAQDLMRK